MPRKAGYRHVEETRARIQAAQIINRLHNHVMADEPFLDASQVNAAKALLNKVIPDLSSVDGNMNISADESLKEFFGWLGKNTGTIVERAGTD